MARLLTLLWKAGALSEIETPRSWGTFFSPILSSFNLKKRTQIVVYWQQDVSIDMFLENNFTKLKIVLWLKYRFRKKSFLYEWNSGQLPISFIKIRFSCNQNTEETLFFTLNECLSNVLITGESNLNERNGQLPRVSFIMK